MRPSPFDLFHKRSARGASMGDRASGRLTRAPFRRLALGAGLALAVLGGAADARAEYVRVDVGSTDILGVTDTDGQGYVVVSGSAAPHSYVLANCPAGRYPSASHSDAFALSHLTYVDTNTLLGFPDMAAILRRYNLQDAAPDRVWVRQQDPIGDEYVYIDGGKLYRVVPVFAGDYAVYMAPVTSRTALSGDCVGDAGGQPVPLPDNSDGTGDPAGDDCDEDALARPPGIGDRFDIDDADRLKRKAECLWPDDRQYETHLLLCAAGFVCIGEDRIPADALMRSGRGDEDAVMIRLLELDGYSSAGDLGLGRIALLRCAARDDCAWTGFRSATLRAYLGLRSRQDAERILRDLE